MQFQQSLTKPCGLFTSTMNQYKKSVLPVVIIASSKSKTVHSQERPSRYLNQIHAFVLRTRTFPDPPPPNFLSHSQLLSSFETVSYFCYILRHLESPELSVDLCNAVLRGISSKNTQCSFQAMVLVREMVSSGFLPDKYTVPYALKVCAQSRAIREGLQIQAYSVKTGLMKANVYVRNTTMRLYAVCGFVGSVGQLFDESSERDLITWTTLIQCYVKNGLAREGVEAFFKMCDARVEPDEMTVVVLLSACAKLGDLELGKKLHEYVIENSNVIAKDIFVANALVDMYLKCNDAESAWKVFNATPGKNVVSWNSLISGLTHQGKFDDALSVFRRMQRDGIKPDDVTLVCVLNSCANLGLLDLGTWVHAYFEKNRIDADGFIGNALVDMYSKCGSVDKAIAVFGAMKQRDVYSYTAIIVGLALNGEAKMALMIFYEMLRVGVKPDHVTFVGVLTACSHAGLVSEGKKFFNDMLLSYGVRPRAEHFGCLVDLLGRAGLIEEAEEVIRTMPMEPDANVLGALLGACKIHGLVRPGEHAMERLLRVEPKRDGAYVLMSNIYSSANKWRDAVKLREEMKEKKVKKTPGRSSIEIDGAVYEFRKGDRSNLRSNEIYKMLGELMRNIKSDEHFYHYRYIFDTNQTDQ